LKFCNLKKQPCKFIKDGEDYPDMKEPICNYQAVTVGKPFEISKMNVCPASSVIPALWVGPIGCKV